MAMAAKTTNVQDDDLDPGCAAFLTGLAAQGGLGAPELGVMRAALQDLSASAGPGPELGAVEDLVIDLPGRSLSARRYRPLRDGCHGLVVFFHGGGFVAGDLVSHDEMCRHLAHVSNLDLLSVGYRLAPEHPWPAAPDDAVDTVAWALTNRPVLGFPAGRLAVAGDSAGGTLATVCALEHRDALKAVVLIYPFLDATAVDSESMRIFGEGYFLTHEMTKWFMAQYLPAGTPPGNPRVSPGRAENLEHLPALIMLTAGYDPLRDQQLGFVKRVGDFGGQIEHLHLDGAIHGFLSLRGVIGPALAERAYRFIATALARQFR